MTPLFKNILVPTDNSDNAGQAFEYAVNMAERYGSTLFVAHVINKKQLDYFYMFKSDTPMSSVTSVEEDIVKERKKETDAFIKKNLKNKKDVTIKRIVRKGRPSDEIIAAARENDVDLIIMGTHGRTNLSHVFMGSVADRVVRKVPCPVLTIKPKDFEFGLP